MVFERNLSSYTLQVKLLLEQSSHLRKQFAAGFNFFLYFKKKSHEFTVKAFREQSIKLTGLGVEKEMDKKSGNTYYTPEFWYKILR